MFENKIRVNEKHKMQQIPTILKFLGGKEGVNQTIMFKN